MGEVIFPEESYRIIGACFEVYNQLGCGFLEAVYQESLEIELADRRIPFVPQASIEVEYKGRALKHAYRADIVCYDSVLLELKAVSHLADEHRAQTLNYLHATRLPLGILINFGHPNGLQHERFLPRKH